MAKKTWIAWALFLLLPGLLGLSIQQAQKNAMLRRMDAAARQVADSPAEQEYLQMYEQWSDLPADQKADNPWGYGSYGGTAIRERLEQEQSDRFWKKASRIILMSWQILCTGPAGGRRWHAKRKTERSWRQF
ncbi:MAG: hypothetical protein ACYSOS_05725 [Planctomycetota bacterium]|jgi:hypothetical protein